MTSQIGLEAAQRPLWSIPPFRQGYILFYLLATLCFHLPLWILQYNIPFSVSETIWKRTSHLKPAKGVLIGRPKRDWSLKQYVMVRWMRHVTHLVLKCRIRLDITDNTIPPAKLKRSKFVLASPVSTSLLSKAAFISQAAKTVGVEAKPVGCYWYSRQGSPKDPTTEGLIALNFHGGAYLLGTAKEDDYNTSIVNSILDNTLISRVFSVDYRLVESTPFPGALLDAISAYIHLLQTERIDPSRIVIMGDSAGGELTLCILDKSMKGPSATGNLALAVARLSRELELPMPGKLLLLSPWADIANSHFDEPNMITPAVVKRVKSDLLGGGLGPYAVSRFRLGHKASVLKSAYISPALLPLPLNDEGNEEDTKTTFKSFPQTFISIGEKEALYDQIRTLGQRMKEAGIDVCERVEEGGVHDFVGFTWFEPQRSRTLRAIAEWIDS